MRAGEMLEPRSVATYYESQASILLQQFDEEAVRWRRAMAPMYGDDVADLILAESRSAFRAMLNQIPYIGGEANKLTTSLVGSAQCLALYQAMKARGHTPAETGKVLWNAILAQAREGLAADPSSEGPAEERAMALRRDRAEKSQLRKYAGDYVYEFVDGAGRDFDYGYNFSECATVKFYRSQAAEEFLPFYCYLDYAWSRVLGLGLVRTMTLAEGSSHCDHRFKRGRETTQYWPPPFAAGE